MASTYSNLKIQLMATGENSGTWGNVTNDNLGVAIEQALVETATVTFASANQTLTLTNTNAAQDARALRLNLTGTTGGARDLIVPAIQKPYIVNNGTADTITVKVTGQTGIAVPAGRSYLLYNNGTDVVNAIEGMSVVSGGTGLETLTAESVVIGNGTNAVKFVAPGTSSNVLTSNGTAWVSQAAAATTNANAITTGILSAGVGGTGANTLTSENVIIGNGTSAVKFVAPGTTGNVLTSNGSAWTSAAAAAGGGNYVMQVYTGPATWTKPASVKAVKVTVLGGGGGGGGSRAPSPGYTESSSGGAAGGGSMEYLAAPAIPGPVSVTVGAGGPGAPAPGSGGTTAGGTGGTSSFGPFLSATGGAGSSSTVGAGGAGSGGQINITGCSSGFGSRVPTPSLTNGGGSGSFMFAAGFGRSGVNDPPVGGNNGESATANTGSGGGGSVSTASTLPKSGGAGGSGLVIVEEFY